MFYRIMIDLAYPTDTNPKAILAYAQPLLKHAFIINPGKIFRESGYVILQECYHDENPTKACKILTLITLPLSHPN